MKSLITLFITTVTVLCYGQTGTASDPFTSLNQAASVTTAGTYYFNITGTTFNTHIDENGYVLVAIQYGNGVGALSQITSLSLSNQGAILNPTVLGALSETAEVRISSADLALNITSTNNALITRVMYNSTLHRGMVDNSINTNWTGPGFLSMTGTATCNSAYPIELHKTISHVCGDSYSLGWIPEAGTQRITWNQGEIASTNSLRLWVKGINELPIELATFEAQPYDNSSVILNWETASEQNNDYFTIERAFVDGDWTVVETISGAGNSQDKISYEYIDRTAPGGLSYYRLKQTDFDGKFSYSKTRAVNLNETSSTVVFPNPTINYLNISATDFTHYRILDLRGTLKLAGEINGPIDVQVLAQGLYIIELSGKSIDRTTFVKQ